MVPHVHIEVRKARPAEQEIAIMDAVHSALVEAFRIPPGDKHIRLTVHEPHRMAVPPSRTQPELQTLVAIDCLSGRSIDAKRRLYAEMTERLAALGIPADHVSIVVRDSPAENWGIAGVPASEIDLGFDVNV
jgi:phenylpyruvate tautomerase PptA (4-oxalocrotonate tautomerase family)